MHPPDPALADFLAAATPRLLRVARRFFPDPADAHDIVHDAIVAGLGAIGAYEGRAALGTWWHRIVVNAALMELRRRRRRRRWLDDDVPVDEAAVADPDPDHDDRLAERECAIAVRHAVDALPARLRQVVLLRDFEDASVDDTALRLAITPNTVRVRHHRARKLLRASLDRPEAPRLQAA